MSPKTRNSARRRASLLVRSAVLVTIAAGAATAAWPQDAEFFEQKDDYFRDETISGVSKHAEALTETPATVTVLDRSDIERYGFATLADVLNFASVGNFVQNDRRYDFAGGRGLFFFEDFNTRILVMLNGHPLNEPWNNFGGMGREMVVPLEIADRVEIIYGPSSLLYGGYSLYGIVNIVTRNGETDPGARVHLSGGSLKTADGFLSYGRSGVSGTASWNLFAAGGYYRSSGEDLDLPLIPVDYAAGPNGEAVWGGPQSGTDAERAPFGFFYGKRGDVSVLFRTGFRKHGAPFAPYGSIYGSTAEFVKDTKHFGEVRWERRISGRLELSARAFYDDYIYEEHDPYYDPESYPGQTDFDFVLRTHDWDAGGEAHLHYQHAEYSLIMGGEYRRRGIDQRIFYAFRDGSLAPDSDVAIPVNGHLAVAYAQGEWRPVELLTLVAGANIADTNPGGQRAQPRAGLILKPRPNLSIKALYNEGFRPPSVFEASYGDFVTQIANPALRSERIRSGELSILYKPTRRLSAQAYVFSSRLIGLIRNSVILDASDVEGGVLPPSGDPAEIVGQNQYQSRGDARTWGGGLALRARVGRRVHSYLNVAYANAQHEHEGTESALPADPLWLGSGGVSYERDRWTVSAFARYVGPQELDADRGLTEHAGDFVEANMRVTLKTRIAYPVRFDLDVRNIFDTLGSQAASFIYTPPTLPIVGRRVLLSADVRF